MIRILCAVLLAVSLAAPSFAAKLYLKDGGVIQAKRVWRADGKVHVLANRDTLTSFEPWEVNLKRTFPPRKKSVKKPDVTGRQVKTAAPTPVPAAAPQKAAEKKPASAPPKLPESLVPSSGDGGTIRQYKKEMQERLKE